MRRQNWRPTCRRSRAKQCGACRQRQHVSVSRRSLIGERNVDWRMRHCGRGRNEDESVEQNRLRGIDIELPLMGTR